MDNTQNTVLVVDDDAKTHLMLRRMLEVMGISTIHAKNGEEAIKLLEMSAIDCIVLDLVMPIMNGFEVVECIKNSSAQPNIPIIMITANINPNIQIEASLKGVDVFLTKPFGIDALEESIRQVLDNKVEKGQPIVSHAFISNI